MQNFYRLLSVQPSATPEEIKRAFRNEIARYHPDKVQHLGKEFQDMAASRAAALTEAYRTLMNAELRADYDRLYGAYRRTLDRSETDRVAIQLFKVLNDELPAYATYESPALMAYASGLRGPKFLSPGPPDGTPMWDIHLWEWARP